MKVWIVYKAWSNDPEGTPIAVKGFTNFQKATLFAEKLQKKLDKGAKKDPFACDVAWMDDEPVEVEE